MNFVAAPSTPLCCGVLQFCLVLSCCWLAGAFWHHLYAPPAHLSITHRCSAASSRLPEQAGADIISIHAEPSATIHLDRIVNQVS